MLSGTSAVIWVNETHRLCQTSRQNEPMNSHMGSTPGASVGSQVPPFRRLLDVLVLWVPSCLWLSVFAASSWSCVLTEQPVILAHTCTHQTHTIINTHMPTFMLLMSHYSGSHFSFSLVFVRVFDFSAAVCLVKSLLIGLLVPFFSRHYIFIIFCSSLLFPYTLHTVSLPLCPFLSQVTLLSWTTN